MSRLIRQGSVDQVSEILCTFYFSGKRVKKNVSKDTHTLTWTHDVNVQVKWSFLLFVIVYGIITYYSQEATVTA